MPKNADKSWISRALAAGGLKAIAFAIVKPALPFLFAALALMTGYFSAVPIPWMWIIMASSLAFAEIAGGVLWFDQVLERGRIAGRVNFAQLRIGKNIHGPGLFLGVWVVNQAASPAEVRLESCRTRIGKYTPENTTREVNVFEIAPHGTGYFDDHVIQIDSPPRPGTLEAFAEFEIEYGRPGRVRHKLPIRKRVTLAFDAEGNYVRASSQASEMN